MNPRDELLRAGLEANRVARAYDDPTRTSLDILQVLDDLDVPVLFRSLDSLLGATLRVDNDVAGVIVTTNRSRQVQRFTLAHELGHYILGHRTTLDTEVEWAPRRGGARSPEDDAAEAFASELLAPSWRVVRLAKQHGWEAPQLKQSTTIYQLSLRLGISYIATCWALRAARVLTVREALALATQKGAVKQAKASIVKDGPEDPWADAWLLEEADDGMYLEAGPGDVFAVKFREHAAAGYLWQLDGPETCRILSDQPPLLSDATGGPSWRRLLVNFNSAGYHRMAWSEKRPWNNETRRALHFGVDNWGKEEAGLPRRARIHMLAEVGA